MPAQNPRYQKPSGCSGCSLATAGFGFAIPSGPVGSRLTFVGEALGWEEAIAGEPFYGSAGGVLSRVLHRAGIARPNVRTANTISCRPPGDYLVGAPWEHHAIASCRQYLQPVLDAVPTDAVVVPLGGTALDAILGLAGVDGVTVKDFHSTVTRDPSNRFWVVPSFHPSHLQRGAMNLLDVVTQDLRLADRIAQQGFVRLPVQLVVDPHPDWFAQWVAGHLGQLAADPDGVHLSLDTEFLEKIGADESEVGRSDTPITRVNGGNDRVIGWTVPYRQPYIGLIEQLLAGVAAVQGWAWLWNKYADWDKLRQAGHTIAGIQAIDGMWAWHHLQSDLPRGLGFVAPMASDFGAWKHWGKDKAREGEYAAADGVQNWRTCMWVMTALQKYGMWDMFMRDWHERDVYALRPAYEMGVPINRMELERFHVELQGKLGNCLERIKTTAAVGVLKPKAGYAKRPKRKPCPACASSPVAGTVWIKQFIDDGMGTETMCDRCNGTGEIDPAPPASILGTPKRGGGEAKTQYMTEGVRLVEKAIDVDVRCCRTCNGVGVGPKHRCPKPRKTRGGGEVGDRSVVAVHVQSPDLFVARTRQTRYFWQLPFNPDAPQQILAYLAQQGIEAPLDKKKGRATTNKKAMDVLKKQYRDDPFFEAQMDYKAVTKVDSTYAVGTLSRLDGDDRVHPEYAPVPSTLRDSARNPNLTNVVADKAGPQGLASGFRRCVESRDGVPPGVTAEELATWEARWGS